MKRSWLLVVLETVLVIVGWPLLDTDVGGITESGVGALALGGGLVFLALGGTLYLVGSLAGPAALPVAVLGGCFTLAGLVGLFPRGKGGHENSE